MATRVLIIKTGEAEHRADLLASSLHAEAETVENVPEALERLRCSLYGAVLAFFPLADWTAEELLEEVQRANPLVPALIVDPGATSCSAVKLARLGAWQVVDLDVHPEHLADFVESASAHQRRRREAVLPAHSREPWRKSLVGESRAMREVLEVVRLIGARRSTVLITGETGTGKEVVARAIHMASPRSHRPLVAVNCSALPENLLEAELFGHVKGAFTGATNHRTGRFEQADGGTLFLDEIGDMPMELQAKLLRAIQEREFQRLGSSETVRVDVRIVAATNADLASRIREGNFREDLYYRLNVVPLALPPLRERLRDIPLLVAHFVEKICRQEGLPPRELGPETFERLEQHDWPGNIRQLENAVEMAVALSGDRTVLYPSDFPLSAVRLRNHEPASAAPVVAVPDDGLDFERTVGRIEHAILEQAMQKTGGNKKQAAEMLRLKRTTFAAKLKTLSAAVAQQV